MNPRRREIEAFFSHVTQRDLASASALALGLVDDGVPVPEVLRRLVAPAQVEIGERWHRNEVSVADEHAVTAVSDAVVSLLSGERVPVTESVHVVVVCAEGEWHLLPARLLAESLRAEGFRVTFLGGSMPAVHLAGFLDQVDAHVLGVSCSTALGLSGLLSCIEVGHAAGIPVLAGGRALGHDDRRARVLGADLWAPDAGIAAELLRQRLPTTLRSSTADTGAAMELALRRDAWVAEALIELATRLPAFQHFTDEQRARTQEDLDYILRFAEAAVLVRDERLFDEFATWLRTLLEARGLPPSVMPLTFAILAAVTGSAPGVAALMDAHLDESAP